MELLGEGTYGKVVKAVRKADGRSFAIKIVRTGEAYAMAAKREVAVLQKLIEGDPDNKKSVPSRPRSDQAWSASLTLAYASPTRSKCVRLQSVFQFRGHVCLVFELLGLSVFDFLKRNSFEPYPMVDIKCLVRHLLFGLACTCGTLCPARRLPHFDAVTEDPFYFAWQICIGSASCTRTSSQRTSSGRIRLTMRSRLRSVGVAEKSEPRPFSLTVVVALDRTDRLGSSSTTRKPA